MTAPAPTVTAPAPIDGPTGPAAALAGVVARERLRIVAALIRWTGDWELAEDSFQDAVARALASWTRTGIPENPGAWLMTTARNACVDALRQAATERTTTGRLAVEARIDESERRPEPDRPTGEETAMASGALDDDRLRLVFTCCHPALAMEARIALTLRTVLGLEVGEIARLFLVTESAMQKRLVRTRAKIRAAGIPYRLPPVAQLPERTDGVLAVLYLLFTEGYSSAAGGPLLRESMAEEAIRLARLVAQLMAGTTHRPEVLGLLALMLLQHSRSAARLDSAGDLMTLEEQDRGLWNGTAITEAVELLDTVGNERKRTGSAPGPYVVQAEIARCHATAPSATATDFARIVRWYDLLVRIAPSPVVELNRAVAVALAHGPDAGLALLDDLDAGGALSGHHLLPASRADLLRRAGRGGEALPHYRRALELAPSDAERRHLRARIAAIEDVESPPRRRPRLR